ncbi:MAG: histidinol-phosphate transaminase, partial [Dehalococcoidales bacterium]|nr:histidinol-phosphate transaminase [Dehalococcoidales bacterium]
MCIRDRRCLGNCPGGRPCGTCRRHRKKIEEEELAMEVSEGIEKFIRPDLATFTGYSASTSPETLAGKVDIPLKKIIKLNANENPYGCSPKVRRALASCRHFNIYPDDGQQELRKRLATYAGVAPEHIVAANGSNTLIDMIVRLFVQPGDEVITCIPTFDIYRFSTELCGGKVVNVLRGDDFAVDVRAVKSAITNRTKLIFLATPNNPTGNIIPRQDIIEILETGIPTVIDEAYYEFSQETMVPYKSHYRNLMVLRTFSKWAGLAGLRVGYGIFPPRIASCLMAIKIPHNVSVAAEIAVRASLADLYYLLSQVKAVIEERQRLYNELLKIPYLKPYPSRANFIYATVTQGSAFDLHQKLQQKGILVRYFDKPLLRNGIRISVGKPEHTKALIKVLKQLSP